MNENKIDEAIAATIGLTEAARDYILAERGRPKEAGEDPLQHLAAIQQCSRLTGLLTNVLSWLMWCKAEKAGEISPEELAVKTDEMKQAMPADEPLPPLPPDLAALVGQGNDLFYRIVALSQGPTNSPP